jgi:hypothetical protein
VAEKELLRASKALQDFEKDELVPLKQKQLEAQGLVDRCQQIEIIWV